MVTVRKKPRRMGARWDSTLKKDTDLRRNFTLWCFVEGSNCNSISGLVVEYIVAIDVTRARFPADVFFIARAGFFFFFSRHHDTAWRGRLPRSRGGGSSQLGIFSSDVQLTSRTQLQGVVQKGAVNKQHGAAPPSHSLSCALLAFQQAAPLPCLFFARFKCRRQGPSPGLSG